MPSAQTPAPPKTKPPVRTPTKQPAQAKAQTGFFADDSITADILPNEELARSQHSRLLKTVFAKSVITAALVSFLIFTLPIYNPIYQYAALDPAGHATPLSPLNMPNMTNRAVLSWAVSSVTEILTIGFGDFEKRLFAQRRRFTSTGWDSFAKAFDNQKTGKAFLENQLVLTTVPSDTPVILAQGLNEDGIYQWKVQVPVVMTYATNNNVTRKEHAIITLTIIRVWPEESPAGIAIKTWS